MADMVILRVLLALLGGTQLLRAEPSPSPTIKSAGKSIILIENLSVIENHSIPRYYQMVMTTCITRKSIFVQVILNIKKII